MQMTEKGMSEGLAKLDKALDDRARRGRAAWEGAAVTVAGELLDAIEPTIPVRTGELAGSGFVERASPAVHGWGSQHAANVEELDGGRGFKFHSRGLAAFLPKIAERMAELLERYTEGGVTASSAPCSWPATPDTAAGGTSRPRHSVERVRAGAPRLRR